MNEKMKPQTVFKLILRFDAAWYDGGYGYESIQFSILLIKQI